MNNLDRRQKQILISGAGLVMIVISLVIMFSTGYTLVAWGFLLIALALALLARRYRA